LPGKHHAIGESGMVAASKSSRHRLPMPDVTSCSTNSPIRVWDLPTRLFHWTLALAIVGSVVSAKVGGNAMTWHFRLGLLALALVAFRLLWGVVGGRWSRFASFIYAPATVLRYLRGQAAPGEHLDVGHNPLGSLSVFALLAIVAVQVTTGLIWPMTRLPTPAP
jgi:cytochrome b